MIDFGYLRKLFVSCLEADYVNVDNGGSYSLLRDGEVLYLYFEKSNGVEDWFNNLSYQAVPRGRAGDEWFCHEGFLRVFESVLLHVEREILNRSVRRIVSVGYSHGAALALLCHEYVWVNRPDIRGDCESFGFGCPRVVWGFVPREGERWRNFYIIRNINDLITHLPPRALGYRHVGLLIEIGGPGKYSDIDAHRAESYLHEIDTMLKDDRGG